MSITSLDIYRSLPPAEKSAYLPPLGMRGAPAVRELQDIARYIEARKRGSYHKPPARLMEMRAAYEASSIDTTLCPIPLGLADESYTRTVCRKKHSRLQNWNSPRPTASRGENLTIDIINEGRYSSRCTYTKYSYTPLLVSAGRISVDGTVLGAIINEETFALRAPRGYRWGIDNAGIRLYAIASPDDDFHPTSDDIRSGINHIVHQVRTNAATRRQLRREKNEQAAIERLACAHGVWISLDDSIRAGNCSAGTIAYCERNHLKINRHYRDSVLTRIEDSKRVRLAISAARKRQVHDWQRGYSYLPTVHISTRTA